MARALREKVKQPKVINPKHTEYKREKLNLREVEIEDEN